MAKENVFEKIHVDETDKADLGGVLDQLNLPPAFVAFVRKNQRTISIILGIITVAVVIWALYGSYLEKQKVASSSALSLAKNFSGDEKISALQKVIADYPKTDSALWAKIEIAQHHIDVAEFEQAGENYSAVLSSISQKNPLYALVAFGLAQATESQRNFDKAVDAYSQLKTQKGYELIGYTGVSRIYEVQGMKEEALKELEQYLAILIGGDPNSSEKNYVTEKITRLKAVL